jgi:hypothetical protein
MESLKDIEYSDANLSIDKNEDFEVARETKRNDIENATNNKIEKTQSNSRVSEIDPLGTPPDGGLNAWLKVLGCFLIYSNIW